MHELHSVAFAVPPLPLAEMNAARSAALFEQAEESMKTHHLLQEDEVVLDAAWCKTVLENAPVLGQLVITSAAILFLAKGKEAVPGLVVPLEQVAEINLAITPEELRAALLPTFERTTSMHHANALTLTASNGDQFGFYAFWTIATLDSAARHLRYAVLRRQELNRDAAPPAPRAAMSGSFSHFRPPNHEHPGRERSSSAGDVQLPVSCLLSTSDKPKRTAHSMQGHREKHALSRSSAGEASRHKAEVVSPRSPRSPRSGHPGHALQHSVSMIASVSLRKSMSTRILDSHHNAFGLSRSPPSASGSFSFAYPASPASSSPSVSGGLASSSSSSSALHGTALSDAVQSTLTRLRISTAEAPVDIMMGECEGNAM